MLPSAIHVSRKVMGPLLCFLAAAYRRLMLQVPRELKRHLFSIEEKILEAQAWEKDSSLYPILIAACSPAKASPEGSSADRDTPMNDSPRDNSPKVGSYHLKQCLSA